MDPECKDTLKENFPNQCFTRDPAAKCVVYEYEATGEKAIHIVRGCRNFTDSCGNINNSLKIQHKKVKGCSFCGTDLCNKYILPKSSKNDKIPKHTNNGSNFGFIFSGPFFFSIVPKCIVRLLFVL
ncbi:hypothetical protein TcasGA2_TC034064 [Tribolium castaneum]|uniref:Uncharacterized protein n=1 Tax=Tribolium castaneum TaxID=7070 RepID=A0A139WDB7_TRICA|nr:hypothetical protein TcasGA2_TC034064 [Tribolium castaneum]